jgi:hypothetical protein
MFSQACNANLNVKRRYKILFLSSNFTSIEVRRAFTCFQLMTILEENHHSFLIVEHDPMLYEDATEMIGLPEHERCSQRGRCAALLAGNRYVPGGS